MEHCIAKITELVTQADLDPRSVLQLGDNLGRLSEFTGLGREPFWDRWKRAVAAGDRARLQDLAQELPLVCGDPPSSTPSGASQPG